MCNEEACTDLWSARSKYGADYLFLRDSYDDHDDT